jgi:hypothetical protein
MKSVERIRSVERRAYREEVQSLMFKVQGHRQRYLGIDLLITDY